MEPSVKDKHIILGFIGVAICLISGLATLLVAESFNQDNFVRLIFFVCSNLLGWLFYFSFQTFIFDTYEIYRIKFCKDKASTPKASVKEDMQPGTLDPTAQATTGEPSPEIKPVELNIDPKRHEENRASFKDRQQQEEEERVRMVMEYIHFIMPRITDADTVNHICGEVNEWMHLHTYKPKPVTSRLAADISNIPLRHFVWNISERFPYKKYYTGDNRANFIRALFPREFTDVDIATIKNFKVDPLKRPIPIDEPEKDNLEFHYPADYVRKK